MTTGAHDDADLYPFLAFTDRGAPCVLRGRPAVAMAYRAKHAGVRGDYFPYSPTGGRPRTGPVILARGGSASIWLAIAVAGHTPCRKVSIDSFLVRLPGQALRYVSIPRPQRSHYAVCRTRTSNELDFSQILRGAAR